MKRTSRLTALILVLLMLVNISASATTTGIPLGTLDINDITAMTANVMAAAEDGEVTPDFHWGSVSSDANFNDEATFGANLDAIPEGSLIKVYGLESSMYRVEYNGQIGYILGKYLVECKCENASVADPATHDATCCYPTYFINLAINSTASELYAVWATFTAAEQAFVRTYLDAGKAAELDSLLTPPVVEPGETEKLDGTTVNVQGDLPEDVDLTLAPVTDAEAYAMLPGLQELGLPFLALDIKLMQGDNEWQPGAAVTVTISADKIGANGDYVVIFHNHEGQNENLGLRQIADGKLTFSVDGFSCIFAINAGTSLECWTEQLQSMTTAKERYEYLMEKKDKVITAFDLFMWHYDDSHKDMKIICSCDLTGLTPNVYAPGASNHKSGCPWHFDNLSSADRLDAFKGMSATDQLDAFGKLTATEQLEALKSVDAAQKEAIAEKYPDAVGKLENVNKTEQNVTVPGSDKETSVSLAISVPQGAFDVDYILNAGAVTDSDQIAQITAALNGSHLLSAFDISFEPLAGGDELQPNSGAPVELTFTIDPSKVVGSMLYVHHLQADGDGYEANVLYSIAVDKTLATQTITVQCGSFSIVSLSSDCDGKLENGGCGVADFLAITDPFKRAEWFVGMLNASEYNVASAFYAFTSCATLYHSDLLGGADIYTLVCVCVDENYAPTIFPYGAVSHTDEACPWHFSQISTKDQATYFEKNNLTTVEQRKAYLDVLTTEQRQALFAYLGMDEIATLQYSLLGKYSAEELSIWYAACNPTVDMLKRALLATELTNVVIEQSVGVFDAAQDADLVYVYTGEVVASYEAATGAIIEPSCQLVIAYVNVSTGEVIPVDGAE